MRTIKEYFLIVTITMCLGTQGSALTYSFKNITHNKAGDAIIGEAQLFMDVTAYGTSGNQVLFTFRNEGPFASSITDIYFDDGTLLSIAHLLPSTGVSFSVEASPKNLPGGKDYDFNPEYNDIKNKMFAVDSNSPTQPNGINPGESLGIVWTLQSGVTYEHTIAALALSQSDIRTDIYGGLRVGIHVQGYASGGSESFINGAAVPDGSSTLLLLGIAFGGTVAIRRFLQSAAA